MNLIGIMGEMFNSFTISDRAHRLVAKRIHPTKTGPGRSVGMRPVIKDAERKLAKRAFQGRLGLRGRVLTGASALAQQNKLGANGKVMRMFLSSK